MGRLHLLSLLLAFSALVPAEDFPYHQPPKAVVDALNRLVMLPSEAHGYRGKESMEHVLYEELAWFDKYLKQPN
jgi:hypothetical protein